MAAAILRDFSNKYEEISPIVRTLDILIEQHSELTKEPCVNRKAKVKKKEGYRR